jgi:hypothetical protein
MSEANVAVDEFMLQLDSIIRIGGVAPDALNDEPDDCEKIAKVIHTLQKCRFESQAFCRTYNSSIY